MASRTETPPPEGEDPRRTEIRALVRKAWTGNRHKDLLQFELGMAFLIADEEWHREAMRRHCDALAAAGKGTRGDGPGR